MVSVKLLSFLALVAAGVQAAPYVKRAGCSSYVIIDTRGTGEMQGPSSGFISMNDKIMSAVPGGTEYDTVYSAGFMQISTDGTNDIVNKITSTLSTDPSTCFVLEGYSQGAAATCNALPQLTGAAFDAVKAVILIGNPEHKPNLACNVDNSGGTSTAGASGLETMLSQGVPDEWVSKTLDICIPGDGVCDTMSGFGITFQHLGYPMDDNVQTMGADFAIKALQGGSSSN
ncbi:alpha/beta-hydrolase [Testicularia cyperi]|uniref:Alpha/beta-hydrolase n=1 Tax=Testicularia cyperi TaxID=1882483 RepID=A0A317XWT5_9BASI|nr:alpha/beta-hydrolase [Testicularia cyperi]